MNTEIHLEPEKVFTVDQELALARAAYAKSGSMVLRAGLVRLLLLAEAFGEVIEVLTAAHDLTVSEELMLTQAYLAFETTEATEAAQAAADRAFALATTDAERANALATRGKTQMRFGNHAAARDVLERALALDPHNKDACKRIAAIDLAAGRPVEVLAVTDDLLGKGAAHARLFAAQTLAHARAGDMAAARKAGGFDLLHEARRLDPPPGWKTIEAFNAALTEELLTHPGIRYERYGSASELTWRIEAPARRDTPLVKALLAQIVAALDDNIARTNDSSHRWAASRPDRALLRNWCVITESDGFETWHVHQFGWLSGVYYVQVPESIANGTSLAGCLSFGLPDDLAGEHGSADYGEHIVRPSSGLFLTFPSHTYHRTYPHGTGEKRICLAFDLRPI